MEYQRTKNGVWDVWQWYDAERVMVFDAVTGEPQRFGSEMNSIGHKSDALQYVATRPGWEDRLVIVKMSCIVAAKS